MKKALCVLAIVAVAGLMAVPPEVYAQGKIKVLSDGPLQPALVQIGEAFRRESGHQVEFTFGTSPVIHKKVADGEVADVLIIQPNFVAELVKAKTIRVDPVAVFERVMQGKGNDIGVGAITLINATKGLRLVGPFPPEVQSYIVYTAAPMTSAASPQAASAFIGCLTSPSAKAVFAATGVES